MCFKVAQGLTLLHRLHYDICGVNLDVSLYRRLQRLGSSGWRWLAMLRKNNGAVKPVPLFPQIKQKCLIVSY